MDFRDRSMKIWMFLLYLVIEYLDLEKCNLILFKFLKKEKKKICFLRFDFKDFNI